MKSSELIKKLQTIDKSVPFDAEVVTGDGITPYRLTKVYHEPPHTFLEFGPPEDEEPIGEKSIDEVLTNYKNAVITKEGAISPSPFNSTFELLYSFANTLHAT